MVRRACAHRASDGTDDGRDLGLIAAPLNMDAQPGGWHALLAFATMRPCVDSEWLDRAGCQMIERDGGLTFVTVFRGDVSECAVGEPCVVVGTYFGLLAQNWTWLR